MKIADCFKAEFSAIFLSNVVIYVERSDVVFIDDLEHLQTESQHKVLGGTSRGAFAQGFAQASGNKISTAAAVSFTTAFVVTFAVPKTYY